MPSGCEGQKCTNCTFIIHFAGGSRLKWKIDCGLAQVGWAGGKCHLCICMGGCQKWEKAKFDKIHWERPWNNMRICRFRQQIAVARDPWGQKPFDLTRRSGVYLSFFRMKDLNKVLFSNQSNLLVPLSDGVWVTVDKLEVGLLRDSWPSNFSLGYPYVVVMNSEESKGEICLYKESQIPLSDVLYLWLDGKHSRPRPFLMSLSLQGIENLWWLYAFL